MEFSAAKQDQASRVDDVRTPKSILDFKNPLHDLNYGFLDGGRTMIWDALCMMPTEASTHTSP